MKTPRTGLSTYCAINPRVSGKGLQQNENNEHWKKLNYFTCCQIKKQTKIVKSYLLNARAKSSADSLIPIDNIIPPRAGAYKSLDTLLKLKPLSQFLSFYTIPPYMPSLNNKIKNSNWREREKKNNYNRKIK